MKTTFRFDWALAALVVWCALILGLACFGFLYPWSHTVYDIYARASRAWWAGQDLYTCNDTAYYRYSPSFAIGVTPFALLPESWGNALWRIFNCLVFAVGVRAWGRRMFAANDRNTSLAVYFLLVLPLSVHSMYNSQANLLMLGCILLGLASAQDGSWNRAAVWIALATLIKGYPIALALLLIALYPRRFALRFIVAMTLGLLLPFALQHPSMVAAQYASWWAHLRESTVIMRERLRSLDHLFAIYGLPLSPQGFLLLQIAAGVGVLALCLYFSARTENVRRQLTVTFVLYSMWVILFGPATESSTYAVIAPAVAWALVDAFTRSAAWRSRLTLVLSLFLMGPFSSDIVGGTLRNFANEHGSQPIGALLLLACLLTRFSRSPVPAVERLRQQQPVVLVDGDRPVVLEPASACQPQPLSQFRIVQDCFDLPSQVRTLPDPGAFSAGLGLNRRTDSCEKPAPG